MGWASSIFPLLQWYSAPGTLTGEFGYSPAPGVGTLVYSNTFAAKDAYNNFTLTGAPAVYNNSSGLAAVLAANAFEVWQGSLSTGWTTLVGSMGILAGARQWQETIGATGIPWDTARYTQVTSATQVINSTTSTPIAPSSGPPLSLALTLGTWEIKGLVLGLQGAATAQQALGIAGTGGLAIGAASALTLATWDATGSTAVGAAELTTLGTRASIGAAITNAHNFFVTIDGTVIVTTAGTLQLTASCVTAAADTWTVLAASKFQCLPVGA